MVGSRPRERRLCYIPQVRCIRCFKMSKVDHSLEERATRLALVWYTNSWMKIICHTFFVRISSVWKATRPYLTSTFQLSGRHRITVTDAAIQRVYLKLAQGVQCISMCLKQHQRTTETGPANKLPKMREEKYAAYSILRTVLHTDITPFVAS